MKYLEKCPANSNTLIQQFPKSYLEKEQEHSANQKTTPSVAVHPLTSKVEVCKDEVKLVANV